MSEEVTKRLGAVIRKGLFTIDPFVLRCYSDDFTEEEPSLPSAVAMPADFAELEEIIREAGSSRVTVVPRCAGTNIGGLCIPPAESVVVDLMLLDEIEHINTRDMTAVVQPGVTWMKLSEVLKALDPPLGFSYPLAPLHSSVMGGCLNDGLGSLSLRHGTTSEMIGGMEVLLPDGKVIHTGAAAVYPDEPGRWLSRAPLPDLSGLFVGWQGTTGIVRRLSLQLWRLPPHRTRLFVLFDRLEDGFDLITTLALRFGLCDDLAGITWPASRYLFRLYDREERDEAEPEFFCYVDVGGFTVEELDWKTFEVKRCVETLKAGGASGVTALDIGDLARIAPSLGVFARQPTTLSFLTSHSYGGMTWVGSYGPLHNFSPAARSCMSVMESYGVHPTLVSRPMKGGHFGVLRFLTIFDKSDREQRKKIRRMNEEIADRLLSFGFIPYKTPPWAWKKLLGRMRGGTADFMRKIRAAIDPHAIMNKGKLE